MKANFYTKAELRGRAPTATHAELVNMRRSTQRRLGNLGGLVEWPALLDSFRDDLEYLDALIGATL